MTAPNYRECPNCTNCTHFVSGPLMIDNRCGLHADITFRETEHIMMPMKRCVCDDWREKE